MANVKGKLGNMCHKRGLVLIWCCLCLGVHAGNFSFNQSLIDKVVCGDSNICQEEQEPYQGRCCSGNRFVRFVFVIPNIVYHK